MTVRPCRCGIVAMSVTTLACGGPGSADRAPETAAGAAPRNGLPGAWRLAEHRRQDGATVTNPVGVYLFSDNRYSITYANTTDPRAPFANPDSPTDTEKLRAYDTFVANAGEYATAGDTLIVHPEISKHPNYMGGGEDRFSMRQVGDTLWLTSVPGAFRFAGQQASSSSARPDSFKLIRTR